MSRTGYTILIPPETETRAVVYLEALREEHATPGGQLRARLAREALATLTPRQLLGALFDTKRPQIFAESAVAGDGTDWTLTELGLLGDLSVAVPVTIFDDGHHTAPTVHAPAFPGVLLFVPGALLRNDRGYSPADWHEVVNADGSLSPEGFQALYRRRLLPVLEYINRHADVPRSAVVTIPGLGCGQFAGPFRGQLGAQLEAVIEQLLHEHGTSLPALRAVWFDPYSESTPSRREVHGISYMVRPLQRSGSAGRPQLCHPTAYAEAGDDFSTCTLYSLVAWDHVSWPGNDFYTGARATDDGVKAAATDAMAVLTDCAGHYDRTYKKYLPPPPFRTWEEVVHDRMRSHGLRLWN